MNNLGPAIPLRERRLWAKEEMLDLIDQNMHALLEKHNADFGDQIELVFQRNRLAKFLGFGPKQRSEFHAPLERF
jgi:hypothetical protein